MDYHAGSKWFIHGPKHHKENQLLSLKHPCWLSLVYHVSMRSVIRKTKSVDKNILGRWLKNRNSIPNISQYITSQDCQHPAQDNQCPKRAGHHRPSLPHQQTHNYMLRPISRIQIHSYIYTIVQTIKCPSQTRGCQEETHCPSYRFRCVLLYLL